MAQERTLAEAKPGWYHGKGDPEGTVRYWDGEQWIGEPVMAPQAPAPAPAAVQQAEVATYGGVPSGGYPPSTRQLTFASLLSRVFSPNGRINRASMAAVAGILIVLIFLLTILDAIAGTTSPETLAGPFATLGTIALLWPQLANCSKRFHDFGLSGWFAALTLIPFVNLLVLVWLIAQPGTAGSNRHGEQPPPGFNL